MIKNIINDLQDYEFAVGDVDIDLAIGVYELPVTFSQAKKLIKRRYGRPRN